MSTDTMLGNKDRGRVIDWKRVADSYRDDMLAAIEWLNAREQWLTNEISGGGNFEHLNARRSECAYIRERFERLSSSDSEAKR